MVAELVDDGRGEAKAGIPVRLRPECKGVSLCAIHPVVVGVPEEPEADSESCIRGIEGKDLTHVVAIPVRGYILRQVPVVVAEQLRKYAADWNPAAPIRGVAREDTQGSLGPGIDGVEVLEAHRPPIVRLQASKFRTCELLIDKSRTTALRIVLEHGDVGYFRTARSWSRNQRVVKRR